MAVVLIWKTGNKYISQPERALEQEIWTPL